MMLIFLLEEISMKAALDELLPKVIPPQVAFMTIKHEGKSDLEKSIPIKLKAFRTPHTYFVILRDKDTGDCMEIKNRLKSLCEKGGRPDTLVRIVCHELESWFLGDLQAVEKAFSQEGLSELQEKAKYRDPDRLANPAQELGKLVPYRKLAGSRAISPFLSVDDNKSRSFQVFISGIHSLLKKADHPIQSS
ncbi:DUF4276 family protein [Paenibacillus pasadenensis]|uniref:DUF4276 family protein n=1 Tax=Paenibacillus TaxID=44249 RepID=UPI00041844D4|nr:DUF4276 family protein [Paenibacillus pasadenensis]